MGLNPKAASRKHDPWATEVTADEILASKVKLIGAVILILADALIMALVGFPNLPPP